MLLEKPRHIRGFKNVLHNSTLNRAMKLFWKKLLRKTRRIYEELTTSYTEVV